MASLVFFSRVFSSGFITLIIFLGLNKTLIAGELEAAKSFHQWMKKHQNYLAACVPKQTKDHYELCDKTLISRGELKELFSYTATELLQKIKSKGIKVEVFCSSNNEKMTFEDCQKNNKRLSFKKNTKLQGQFKPLENTILLRSHGYKGSLIHEYIHYLQYKNKRKLFGKRYKSERVEVESGLVKKMDEIISQVQVLEKKKDRKESLNPYLKKMLSYSKEMAAFSQWQDLIDERNIFLLYLNFGHEFNLDKKDRALARKNLGFICKREDLRDLLSDSECEQTKARKPQYKEAVLEVIKEIRPTKLGSSGVKEVESFLANLPLMPEGKLEKKIAILSHYIFKKLKIEADTSLQSRKNQKNILPDTILQEKLGHCVGLTTLYLMAAEKWGLEAHLIRIPNHVFPKICFEGQCLNIETLKNGKIVENKFYFDNAYTTKEQVQGTTYFNNLSTGKKLKSSLYLSLGYISFQAKQYALSEFLYKKSIDSDRSFAEGYLNLASTYSLLGKKIQAQTYLNIAEKINPKHIPTLINKAISLWNKGQEKPALILLKKAQKLNPLEALIYRTRARFMNKNQRHKKELTNLLMVSNIRPKDCSNHKRVLHLKTQMKKTLKENLLKEVELIQSLFTKNCNGL